MSNTSDKKLVEIQQVSKYFKVNDGTLKAVDHVNLDIYQGETLGLVGESGCGKSTFGKVLMGIYPATEGKIVYHGKEGIVINKMNLFKYSKVDQLMFLERY